MKFSVSYVTNIGRARENNQDSLLVQDVLLNKESMDAPSELELEAETAWFIVADGMGGEDLGEVASGETLRVLAQHLPELESPEAFPPLLDLAVTRLDEIARHNRVRLGTTLAGIIVTPQGNLAFNVGDCRVYQVEDGLLNRLTRDHSLLEAAIAAGQPPESVSHNIVTAAVMGGEVDVLQVYTHVIDCRPGDTYLICCDGLWGALSTEEMQTAIADLNPKEATTALLAAALAKSDDNISAIIVRIS